jgi:hypothetical protein
MEELSKNLLKEKKIDLWYDKPFVKVLVNKAQKISPDVWAVIYPDIYTIVFLYKGIIVHKLYLDKFNTDSVDIDYHLEKIRSMVNSIKLGLLPISLLKQVRKQAKKLNPKLGKILF